MEGVHPVLLSRDARRLQTRFFATHSRLVAHQLLVSVPRMPSFGFGSDEVHIPKNTDQARDLVLWFPQLVGTPFLIADLITQHNLSRYRWFFPNRKLGGHLEIARLQLLFEANTSTINAHRPRLMIRGERMLTSVPVAHTSADHQSKRNASKHLKRNLIWKTSYSLVDSFFWKQDPRRSVRVS